MDREHVQRVVDHQYPLDQPGRVKAHDAGGQADHQRAHRADKPGGRRNRAQSRHHSGHHAQHAGLAEPDPFHRHPAQGPGRRTHVSNQQGHCCGAIGGQSTASVEAEPSHPEHAGAGHRQRQTVRRHGLLRKPGTGPQHQRRYQRGHARGQMDHGAAGEVQKAQVRQPAAAPDPMTHRGVDDQRPEHREQEHGREPHAFGETTHNQGAGDDGESQLKGEKDRFRRRTAERVNRQSRKEGAAEAPYPLVHGAAVAERQAVLNHDPQHGHDSGDRETLHQYR